MSKDLKMIRRLLRENSIIFTSTQERRKKAKYEKEEKFCLEKRICYVVVNLLRKKQTLYIVYLGKKVIDITIAVMMAKRIHLFPFRTQKLSSFTPKVLTVNRWEDR